MDTSTEARVISLVAKLMGQRRSKTPDARVTIRIEPEMHERLKELEEITGVRSANDVVRNALFFYDAMVKEQVTGNSVCIISQDGVQTKFPVFIED